MKEIVTLVALAITLAGCSTQVVAPDHFAAASSIGNFEKAPVRPRHVVGRPYFKDGTLTRPRHQPKYSAIGQASWYGPSEGGRRTANGEIVDATNLFAAHATLPLPSYVSVENLNNGRKLTVRVNDRNPVSKPHIIGLSLRAAELLGLPDDRNARVHVRFLSPAPIEHAGRNHNPS